MSDEKLLQSISDMLDEKLDRELSGIRGDVSVLKEDVSVLKEDVSVLKEDVSGLKEDVSVLKEDVSELKGKVTRLEDNQETMANDITDLKKVATRLDGNQITMAADIAELKDVTKRNNLILENEVLPQLREMQACYTDTYKRYRDGIATQNKLVSDNELYGIIIKEHSKQIAELQSKVG